MPVSDLFEIGQIGLSLRRDAFSLFAAEGIEKLTSIHIPNNSISLLKSNSRSRVARDSILLSNSGMDNKTVRRENLIGLLREAPSDAEFARVIGMSDRLISQWKNGTRLIGDKGAKKLEAALKKPHGWLDTLHFHSADHAMYVQEAAQIIESLMTNKADPDLEGWMKHGRVLVERLPVGPQNPFPFPPGKEPKTGRGKKAAAKLLGSKKKKFGKGTQ